MAERELDPAIILTLTSARQAIDRGEYGQCLRLLEPLEQAHGPASPVGAGVRLLMATALMGQGQTELAADCCRCLQACVDATLRARAKELLMVLEAPSLQRPRNWSLTLPDLGQQGALLEGSGAGLTSARRRPPAPPRPRPPRRAAPWRRAPPLPPPPPLPLPPWAPCWACACYVVQPRMCWSRAPP
jgi:hypothetical protein